MAALIFNLLDSYNMLLGLFLNTPSTIVQPSVNQRLIVAV